MPRKLQLAVLIVATAVLSVKATGNPKLDYCPPESEFLDKHEYLKALSLDLRGEAPSLQEYTTLSEQEKVTSAQIDSWLNSDAFADQVSRFHRSLLWNRVMGTRLVERRARLHTKHAWFSAPALSNAFRTTILRGANAPCFDKPAQFDPDTGNLIYEFDPVTGANREGWIEVSPYWAPDTKVKVCAADAQTNLKAPDGTLCSSRLGLARASCGCGPNLNWCVTDATATQINIALGKSIDIRVKRMIQNSEPYTDLFTKNVTYMNGPLIHYWRYVAPRWDTLYVSKPPVPPIMLPDDVPFTATDTWAPVQLGAEHAGVLTHAAYLMRHTTSRRRAMRFIDGLICQPLVLPESGLEIVSEGLPDPDVTKQPGCKYCHAILEPTAQHWGRWTEFGVDYLSPDSHPPCRADCKNCALKGNCGPDCRFNYVTQGVLTKELKFLGWLKPYQFLVDDALLAEIDDVETKTQVQCQPDLVEESKLSLIEKGPLLLIQKAVFSGQLARCAAQNVIKWLMNREGFAEDDKWIDTLASEFQASNFDYKAMVKSVVDDPRYRRVK